MEIKLLESGLLLQMLHVIILIVVNVYFFRRQDSKYSTLLSFMRKDLYYVIYLTVGNLCRSILILVTIYCIAGKKAKQE